MLLVLLYYLKDGNTYGHLSPLLFFHPIIPNRPHRLKPISSWNLLTEHCIFMIRHQIYKNSCLKTNDHMSASRVHSWIENLTRRKVEELDLWLDQEKPFFVPLSLFTCKSLIKLELVGNDATHLPRSFCFPKLKRLKPSGIRFTDDCSWNEQHFSNCPVLESLTLGFCTWSNLWNFCISIPTLKLLEIYNSRDTDDGLRNCALKIDAPNLETLTYIGRVAKDYVLSCFPTLVKATVDFYFQEYGALWEQVIAYGAVACKFL